MDILSIVVFVGGILFIYLVPPRWLRIFAKNLLKESLGSAILEVFSGRSYVDPETGEETELEPHVSMYLFASGLVQEAVSAASGEAAEELAPFLACMSSETAAKKMSKTSRVAKGFLKLPKGIHGLQAVKKSTQQLTASAVPKPPEGIIGDLIGGAHQLQSLGFDVKGGIAKLTGGAAKDIPAVDAKIPGVP